MRHRCHPTKCPLFPIYTGIQALCWPNTIYKGIKALFWVTHSILGLVSSLNQFLLFWGRELIGSVSSTISQVFRQLSINPSQLGSMEGGHYTTIQISNPDRFLQIFWHQTQNICVLQHLYQISSKMLLDKNTRVRQNHWFKRNIGYSEMSFKV